MLTQDIERAALSGGFTQNSSSPPKATEVHQERKPVESLIPDPSPVAVEQSVFQDRRETSQKFDYKRKRSQEPESPQVSDEPAGKRARTSQPNLGVEDKEAASDTDAKKSHPVKNWIQEGNWPREYFEPAPNMSQQLTKKRSSSAMSYSQGVKEGEYPPAHTPAYEKQVLEPARIIMDQQLDEAAISDDCKQLCTTLVDAKYDPPRNSLFEGNLFWKVLNGVRSRNEPRVVRDISPLLIPSVELLFMRGISELKDLTEEIQADWTKCVPLVGPLPRPDFTVGFQSSAFTHNEMDKLRYYSAPEKPTLFTGDLYFPFLICEAKCGENGLNIADRQNARSASTAVNAILQLYGTVSRAEQLHRKVLVFSISHDHCTVKIYGHYALIKDKTTFHRHLIHSFDLTAYGGQNRWTAYNFVRKIYDHFAPIHLERIRDAVALFGPASESVMSTDTAEGVSEFADSQVIACAPHSQGTENFKKPKLPPKTKRQQEIDRKGEQINDLLREELAREKEESKQRHEELMEQNKELLEQNKKLMEMLAQRLS
ncbi:MAG: hypothetical protein Q9217_001615 [Psora testacea]